MPPTEGRPLADRMSEWLDQVEAIADQIRNDEPTLPQAIVANAVDQLIGRCRPSTTALSGSIDTSHIVTI